MANTEIQTASSIDGGDLVSPYRMELKPAITDSPVQSLNTTVSSEDLNDLNKVAIVEKGTTLGNAEYNFNYSVKYLIDDYFKNSSVNLEKMKKIAQTQAYKWIYGTRTLYSSCYVNESETLINSDTESVCGTLYEIRTYSVYARAAGNIESGSSATYYRRYSQKSEESYYYRFSSEKITFTTKAVSATVGSTLGMITIPTTKDDPNGTPVYDDCTNTTSYYVKCPIIVYSGGYINSKSGTLNWRNKKNSWESWSKSVTIKVKAFVPNSYNGKL